MIIGDRQTVQRAKHPKLGEGRLVYGNGPVFFLADSGEVEPYDRAGWSGSGSASSSRGEYREHYAERFGARVLFDSTGRDCGATHERIVSQDGRAGWLVRWNDKTSNRERFHWERFEPDNGDEHETMMNQVWWRGEAKHEKKSSTTRGNSLEEREPWMTSKSIGGHLFTYRRECDPLPSPPAPKPSKRKPSTAQGELFTGAK